MRITEIAFDGQSFKAPELPKKEKKVKKAAPGRLTKVAPKPGRIRRRRRPGKESGSEEEE